MTGTWDYAGYYDSNWAWSVVFTPSQELAEKVWHVGMVEEMQDSHGHRMAVPHGWSFRTGDYTPPVVSEVMPTNGAEGVSVHTAVTAQFDEALDETRLDEVQSRKKPPEGEPRLDIQPGSGPMTDRAALWLFPVAGPAGAVSGTVEVVQGAGGLGLGTKLRFSPTAALSTNVVYTAEEKAPWGVSRGRVFSQGLCPRRAGQRCGFFPWWGRWTWPGTR